MFALSTPQLTHRIAPARTGEPPHPCLLLLHGRGADEQDLLALGQVLDPRFFLVAARAPLPVAGMWGYEWHASLAPGVPDPASQQRSLALLRGFVGGLAAAHPIDPHAVFVLGFSQGAAMALALSAAEPAAVRGTLALSGYWPPPDQPPDALAGRPFFVAHGTMDPVLPVARGRAVRETLTAAGAALTYREYPMGHQIVDQEIADVNAWLRDMVPPAG